MFYCISLSSQYSNLANFVTPSNVIEHQIAGGFTSGFAYHVQIGKLVIIEYSCLYTGSIVAGNRYVPFTGFPLPVSVALSTINERSLASNTRYETQVNASGQISILPAATITNEWLQGQLVYVCN